MIVNRVWADLMGRGLVEPVDDLRATNPPTNGPLLEALAKDFQEHGYDLKQLIRTIMASRVYALSPTADRSQHGRYPQLLPPLPAAPAGRSAARRRRATSPGVPDIVRRRCRPVRARTPLWTVRTDSLFLDTFGRPDPNQDPPCERTPDTTVTQALHLMNAPALHAKITSDDGLRRPAWRKTTPCRPTRSSRSSTSASTPASRTTRNRAASGAQLIGESTSASPAQPASKTCCGP